METQLTEKEKTLLSKLRSEGYKITPPNSSRGKNTKHKYGDYHTNCSCITCQDSRCDAENFP